MILNVIIIILLYVLYCYITSIYNKLFYSMHCMSSFKFYVWTYYLVKVLLTNLKYYENNILIILL